MNFRVAIGALALVAAMALPALAQDDFGDLPSGPSPGARAGIGCVAALVGGAVGYAIGKSKGMGLAGLLLGVFLGCIGWLIIALIPGSASTAPVAMRRRRLVPRAAPPPPPAAPAGGAGLVACPYCAEMIQPGARLCRHCKSRLK
jgi:hypothetical protein